MTIVTVSADIAAQAAESLLQANADRLVHANVQACLSSMVATLAAAWGVDHVNSDMDALHEQAQELCYANTDWDEAATQAGWTYDGNVWRMPADDDSGIDPEFGSAEEACEFSGVDEPYHWEVFEHWAVSTWLAEKLQEAGERVDTDFAGLNVWARTTTGQAISMDAVIHRITTELHAETPAV